MLKIKALTIVFIVFVVANSLDYDAVAQAIKKLDKKQDKLDTCERQLRRANTQLADCLRKVDSSKADTSCYEERSLKEKLADKVKQLQNKVLSLGRSGIDEVKRVKDEYEEKIKTLVQSGKRQEKADAQQSVLTPLKDKILQLEKKLRGEASKAQDLFLEKTGLQRKIDLYKADAQDLQRKIQLLQKARDQVDGKCTIDVTQYKQKQQQCKTRLQRFTDKVKELEQSVQDKARDVAQKISETKTQVVGRIKNFLTGKGPYNRQDEVEFAEFKQKVSSLQTNLKDKVDQIVRIKKQKEDMDFQQRYCKAQLTDFDQQIRDLQKEAEAKGKKYYIDQIKRLQRERAALKSTVTKQSGVKDDLYRTVQDKLAVTEQKLRKQLEQYDLLYSQKKSAEERARKCERQLSDLKSSGGNYNEENIKLRQQNRELRKLIQEIYDLKMK